jgi:arylsulfatase
VKALLTITTVFVFLLSSCDQKESSKNENAIPYPNAEWKGVKGKTLADSKPDFFGQPQAPEGAPNVLVIMLDDAGYSNASSYGGVMKTPTFIF